MFIRKRVWFWCFLICVSLDIYNTQFLSVWLIYDWFWIARCHNGIQLNIKYAENEWNSIKTGSFIQYYNGWDCTKWILPISKRVLQIMKIAMITFRIQIDGNSNKLFLVSKILQRISHRFPDLHCDHVSISREIHVNSRVNKTERSRLNLKERCIKRR